MDEIEAMAKAHLSAIEIVNEVKLINKNEIVRLIAQGAKETKQVFLICTSINLWVARNKIQGEFQMPIGVLSVFMDTTINKS